MTTAFYMFILFLAKVLDNTLNTAKTILVQRNRCLLAGVALGLSNFIYLSITKDIVTSDSTLALVIVSIASGVGCCLAVALSNRFSKDRTYVNVILSDDKEAMKEFRDFLAENHITNVATDSYTLDWSRKSISITAYAQTKAQSRLIDEYLERSLLKCKRVIRKNRERWFQPLSISLPVFIWPIMSIRYLPTAVATGLQLFCTAASLTAH